MKNQVVLILSYSPLNSDPRILRQASALKNEYTVETCALAPINDNSIQFHQIYTEPKFSLLRKFKRLLQFTFRFYECYYWDKNKIQVRTNLEKKNYSAIIANDIHTLPLALAIANNKPIVYFDAHEYHPKEFEDNLKWVLFHKPYIVYLCKKYINRASAFSTVAEGIASEYGAFIGIKPIVITNASSYSNCEPNEIGSSSIRLVHHGAAIKGRQIEKMIDSMNFVHEKFSLHLMLTGKGSNYYSMLLKQASSHKNVFFIDPVPFQNIVETINKYDIGVYLLPPTNFNNMNALPNKLFEFIQAKLAIIVSPNPEMATIVNQYSLGKVSSSFSVQDLANTINSFSSEEIKNCKINSKLASKIICAEENIKLITQIITTITKQS